MVLLRFYH